LVVVETVVMAISSVDERLFDAGEPDPVAVRERAPVDKTFLEYDQEQVFLLPPSLLDWLPEDHLARVVSDVVEHTLDLSVILASYTEQRGAPPFDPRLMLKLLIYGYATGVCSSRKIEARCHDDVAFRFLAANARPDFRSIARFRKRHLGAFTDLFVQVLAICKRAGLVKLGRVALDGTKVRANASRRKAMSYDRMTKREAELAAEIAELEAQAEALLAEAEHTDAAEDARYGAERRGDELPAELARRRTRLATIRKAKADLEADAAQVAAERVRARARRKAERAAGAAEGEERAATPASGEGNVEEPDVGQRQDAAAARPEARVDDDGEDGTVVDVAADGDDPADDPEVEAAARAAAAVAVPKPKAQRNFTDPDSRIMKTSDGSFHQCYNGQAVVDEAAQIIVAMKLTNRAGDAPHLPDLLDEVAANLGELPRQLLADAGYFSADNVAAAAAAGVDALLATGRFKHQLAAYATTQRQPH
jgi:transposase